MTLHSTISPLTPTSPLYPDGIITPLWITKHQSRLPAIFISFFALTTDPNTSSLRDNQIKVEVGNIRGVFSSTNYKTKLVVVLIRESGNESLFGVEERLESIRRATGLDSRHLFYFNAQTSREAASDFVKNVLTSLQPFSVEYYRDLSKHARRKRNRSSVPPPTAPPTYGTSQTLPLQGWNVRYEFKLGVFAEFRQEMDAACRNYESAYEGLFSQDLFETISSWNPRFNEARLLADAIAIRILRCLLWTAQPTSAARFWNKHRNRMKDLVNRRGKGSDIYGWEAWEAVWSKSFAQMLARAARSEISSPDTTQDHLARSQFSPAEKSIPSGERIAPWDLLHHDGYWWNRAWKHTRKRRELVLQMPEEDRTSPGQSPASAIANRSHLYDTYLALEPHLEYPLDGKKGYNYSLEIVDTIQSSVRSFSRCHQMRFVEQLRLEEAKELLREERWQDALGIAQSIWPCLSWRRAGWWEMVVEVARTFEKAAKQTGDAESLLRLEWEAQSSIFPLGPEWKYNLCMCLDEIKISNTKPNVVVRSEDSLSPVWALLQFATSEGNVGEPLRAQLVLNSTAHRRSAAINLSEVKIVFEGGLRPIKVLSNESEAPTDAQSTTLSELRLRESSSSTASSTLHSSTSGLVSLVGVADIRIQPGERKIFDMVCTPREAGDVKVASINLLCETNAFSLTYVISQQIISDARWWTSSGNPPRSRQLGRDGESNILTILPKPPKVRIDLADLKELYYTNEKISLTIVIKNHEAGTAEVSLNAKLASLLRHEATIQWKGTDELDCFDLQSNEKDVPPKEFLFLPDRSIGSVPSGGSQTLVFVIDRNMAALQYQLHLTARYYLQDDPETVLTRESTVELRVSRPFEANYELLPRVDMASWPSFFDPHITFTGLSQKFLLVSKIASFAVEPVIIEGVSLRTQNILGNAVCTTGSETTLSMDQKSRQDDKAPSTGTIVPEGFRESSFELLVRKDILGDSHSIALDLALHVEWRRSPEEDIITSTLDVPRYVIPMSEPRVLLSKRQETSKNQPGLVQIQYTIENPSMHYLTFNLSMESSDEFGFSGPKTTSFSLVPLSRHTVDYRVLAHDGGRWIRINLGVVDAYYSKALRVSPASQGVRSDGKRGLLVWVE